MPTWRRPAPRRWAAASAAAAIRGAPEFRFRIVNELAYFTREYDPTNPAHRLAIGFTTSADLRRFEAEVYPMSRRRRAGRPPLTASAGGTGMLKGSC